MARFAALNLNHRTRPVPVKPAMVDHLTALGPDVLVFNEYVDQTPADELKCLLAGAGYRDQFVSASCEYRPGRWHNQILIASKVPLIAAGCPSDGPDVMCSTNTAWASVYGIQMTGLRAPAYTRASEWYAYWSWANKALQGDLIIGDFNADPSRMRKWDRVLCDLETRGNWRRPKIDGSWSYRGANGSTSCVDHVLVKQGIEVTHARYVPDPFVPAFTDHAVLLIDVNL